MRDVLSVCGWKSEDYESNQTLSSPIYTAARNSEHKSALGLSIRFREISKSTTQVLEPRFPCVAGVYGLNLNFGSDR
jgi:hypothetical protein